MRKLVHDELFDRRVPCDRREFGVNTAYPFQVVNRLMERSKAIGVENNMAPVASTSNAPPV